MLFRQISVKCKIMTKSSLAETRGEGRAGTAVLVLENKKCKADHCSNNLFYWGAGQGRNAGFQDMQNATSD